MRLLLDSNIVVPLAQRELHKLSGKIRSLIEAGDNDVFISAASLWEIAIKTRLGKFDPKIPLADLAGYLRSLGYALLAIDERHALEDLTALPPTRDPFDRLLLAQCQVEDMKLVTTDGQLAEHPLAWRG